MAGGQADRHAARIVQIQHGLNGKLGCEDGIRRDQAISDIADSHLDECPWPPDGCSAGRDAGCSGSACFENSETEFRYSRCSRQGDVEAPVLRGRVAKHVRWKAEEKWKAEGRGSPFSGQHDNEHVLRGMMWADNDLLFCDNRERLVCMVNDIIEELLDLDMEPKLESVWCTSTHKHEDVSTLRVGSRGTAWDLSFRDVFEVLGYRRGKVFQGAERTMCKGLWGWWRDEHIYRSRTVPMATKCRRVNSQVYGTALDGSMKEKKKMNENERK